MSLRFSTRTTPDPTVTEERGGGGHAVRLYCGVAAALTLLVALAPRIWARGDAPPRPHMVADWLLGNWLWWDGGWYLHIAQHGYSFHPHQQSSVAFFPAYPMAVRAVGALVPGGVPFAALVVTMLSGIAVLVLFQRWCQRRLAPGAASWAVVSLALYPYAWFLYGAAYSDALFLAVTLLAFLLLEQDRPIAAGLVGIVATAARPTGVVVLIGLIAVMLDRRGVLQRVGGRVRPRDLGVGLAAIGIGAWCVWLAVRFGERVRLHRNGRSEGLGPSPRTLDLAQVRLLLEHHPRSPKSLGPARNAGAAVRRVRRRGPCRVATARPRLCHLRCRRRRGTVGEHGRIHGDRSIRSRRVSRVRDRGLVAVNGASCSMGVHQLQRGRAGARNILVRDWSLAHVTAPIVSR